jgi:hypothetical protein
VTLEDASPGHNGLGSGRSRSGVGFVVIYVFHDWGSDDLLVHLDAELGGEFEKAVGIAICGNEGRGGRKGSDCRHHVILLLSSRRDD